MSSAPRALRPWLRRLAISFFVCLGLVPAARAQQPPTPLTLEDCIKIGLERQPALAAQHASLSAAEAQRRALDNMRVASLLSK